MNIDVQANKPIYVQIAEIIEDQILLGHLKTDERVYSTNELAKRFNVNPATAGKGLNMLIQEDILYKRRGLGMFVSPMASEQILNKRIKSFQVDFLERLVIEAKKLGLNQAAVVKMIKKCDWSE